jgi:DNA-3-methyladenine glycosylase I
MSYCTFVQQLADGEQPEHQHYHHHQYGFPIANDDELFERLVLEINQAGLSWTTILKKQAHFKKAYHQFSIKIVAGYKEADRTRLLLDAGIIRNRLKVDAAIYNAQVILGMQQDYGSFKQWLDEQHPLTKAEWVALFKKHFKFTGGEIVNEFLMSTGYLPGAHDADCPVHAAVIAAKPPWLEVEKSRK